MIIFLLVFVMMTLFSLKKDFLRTYFGNFFVLFFLSILYFFGSLIWNFIRGGVGPGYLGFLSSSPDNHALFQKVMSPVIYGVGFSILIKIARERMHPPRDTPAEIKLQSALSKYEKLLIYFPFLIYLIGQGTSIFVRNVYLQTNGIGFIERLSGVTNLVSLGGIFFAMSKTKNLESRYSILPTLFWYLLLMSSGTRLAILPLILLLYWIYQNFQIFYLRFILFLFVILCIRYSYDLILLSRSNPIGLFRLPENLANVIFNYQIYFAPVNVLDSILGGIFTVVLTVPLSIGSANWHSVLLNANPLISNISAKSFEASSNGVERIYPYSWIPTSTAGVFYGTIGVLAIFLIFFTMTWAQMETHSTGDNAFRSILSSIARIVYFAQFFFYLEYSSRIWFRLFWAFWLAILVAKILPKSYRTVLESQGRGEGSVNEK